MFLIAYQPFWKSVLFKRPKKNNFFGLLEILVKVNLNTMILHTVLGLNPRRLKALDL